jgi:hypothetical protein
MHMALDQLGTGDILGILGFLVYACADTLLALRRLHSDQIRFYAIYACAGLLILSSLTIDFNMGAFLSEAFTLLTCMVAIALRLARPAVTAIRPTADRPGRSRMLPGSTVRTDKSQARA